MSHWRKTPLITEMDKRGRSGVNPPAADVPRIDPGQWFSCSSLHSGRLPLPSVSEPDVVRHFTELSQKNHGLDSGFYPLGSCTMKYNPKFNEDMAGLAGFSQVHPLQPDAEVQGALRLMYDLGEMLCALTGMEAATLQPAAGAQGESTGLAIMKAYHLSRGDAARTKILVPDSSHGTNPASATLAGFQVVVLPSDSRGCVSPEAVRKAAGPDTAGLMLTNPNTLGLFEPDIEEITRIVHEAGGLLYYDGANMNAIMGVTRPGDMGFDIAHINVHKTLSTPHGGGGPGAGPVMVKAYLEPFLPVPVIVKIETGSQTEVESRTEVKNRNDAERRFDGENRSEAANMKQSGRTKYGTTYVRVYDRPLSIGKVKAFFGNFGILVRAYAYMRTMGNTGLHLASKLAVLHANYLRVRLSDAFTIPFPGICMHEFVLSAEKQAVKGVTALVLAKNLIDAGMHPPTVYFPLIVKEAMMVEPTETESLETLDRFADEMLRLSAMADTDADYLMHAPYNMPVNRLDEVGAARKPVLCQCMAVEDEAG